MTSGNDLDVTLSTRRANGRPLRVEEAMVLASMLLVSAACGAATASATPALPAPAPGGVTAVIADDASVPFGYVPPASVALAATAVGTGTVDTAIAWELESGTSGCGPLGASVTSGGLFTAPTSPQTSIGQSCRVVARAVADSSKVGLSTVTITAPPTSGPTNVWVAPGLSRIFKNSTPTATTAAALYAGRNEYEAFQVGIQGPVTVTAIAASSLTGPGGAKIDAGNVAVFVERYQNIATNTATSGTNPYRPGPTGYYPDGLVPLKTSTGATNASALPFTVASGESQPLWLDVFVPTGTTPGVYNGSLTITANEGVATVPITLTVWKFTLPATPSLETAFAIRNSARRDDSRFQRLLLQNKISPQRIAPAAAPDLAANWGLTASNLQQTWSNNGRTAPPSPATLQSYIDAYPTSLPLWVYTADEPTSSQFPALCSWTRNIHGTSRTPPLRSLITTYPQSGLLDDGAGRSCADVWVMLPLQFVGHSTAITAARGRGEQVWSYTDMNLDTYSPKWEIDYGLPDYRIFMGFMSWAVQSTGVLYWGVDFWEDASGAAKNPWTDPYWYAGSGAYPGEALLIYPGSQVGISDGPVPSIRLKWLRDGVEDYDYFTMLKAAGADPAFISSTLAPVATDWRTWSKDPAVLQNARNQLGRELDRLTQ